MLIFGYTNDFNNAIIYQTGKLIPISNSKEIYIKNVSDMYCLLNCTSPSITNEIIAPYCSKKITLSNTCDDLSHNIIAHDFTAKYFPVNPENLITFMDFTEDHVLPKTKNHVTNIDVDLPEGSMRGFGCMFLENGAEYETQVIGTQVVDDDYILDVELTLFYTGANTILMDLTGDNFINIQDGTIYFSGTPLCEFNSDLLFPTRITVAGGNIYINGILYVQALSGLNNFDFIKIGGSGFNGIVSRVIVYNNRHNINLSDLLRR